MKMTSTRKCKFARHLYLGHPYLVDIKDFKITATEKKSKSNYEKKNEILKVEKDAVFKSERLRLFRLILLQP